MLIGRDESLLVPNLPNSFPTKRLEGFWVALDRLWFGKSRDLPAFLLAERICKEKDRPPGPSAGAIFLVDFSAYSLLLRNK